MTTERRRRDARTQAEWTADDLRRRARELDIEGRWSMTKSELVDALRHH
jgi:hypothetical protein